MFLLTFKCLVKKVFVIEDEVENYYINCMNKLLLFQFINRLRSTTSALPRPTEYINSHQSMFGSIYLVNKWCPLSHSLSISPFKNNAVIYTECSHFTFNRNVPTIDKSVFQSRENRLNSLMSVHVNERTKPTWQIVRFVWKMCFPECIHSRRADILWIAIRWWA